MLNRPVKPKMIFLVDSSRIDAKIVKSSLPKEKKGFMVIRPIDSFTKYLNCAS